jgi:hypothetical protein
MFDADDDNLPGVILDAVEHAVCAMTRRPHSGGIASKWSSDAARLFDQCCRQTSMTAAATGWRAVRVRRAGGVRTNR